MNIGPVGIQNCVITDTKICAGGVPDRGPCRGDSGSTFAIPCLPFIWVQRQVIPEIKISKQRSSSWVTNYDSGGALVAQDNDLQGWAAVGLVSYQPGNILEWPECGSDKFTVFTEVSK